MLAPNTVIGHIWRIWHISSVYLGAPNIAKWGIPGKIIPNQVLVGRPHFDIYINVKLEVVTKSTDIGRKGRTAKTKTVLKSMNKMFLS